MSGADPRISGASRGARLSPPSMTQLAADALRAMILAGELRPGDRVVESRITEELGVSRPPLREALRVLEHEGLVEQLPRRGVRVPAITLQDIYEIYSLREGLEHMALALALPIEDTGRLADCREALAEMQTAAGESDAAGYTDLAFRFHTAIVALSGNRRLVGAYRSVANQLRLCMAMNRRAREDHETLEADTERHRKLLAAIESGVVERAQHALTIHGHRTFLLSIHPNPEEAGPEAISWLLNLQEAEREFAAQ